MDYMALEDRHYCVARGTRTVATSAYSSDGSSDISRLLLLPPTIAMGYMISEDRCYYGTRGMHAVATNAHISDDFKLVATGTPR
jgi:hypothetical protein